MSTQPTIKKIPIPDQLQDWRPACGMHEAWSKLNHCQSSATHACIHHSSCAVVLTCTGCYERYLAMLADWAKDMLSGSIRCKVCCSQLSDSPADHIRLEKI